MTYIDKPLNWEKLCHKDLGTTWTNEPLLKAIVSRDIKNKFDWYALSSNPEFPVSLELLSKLPSETLNWEEMSKHKAVFSVIDQYEEYIDWHNISENISLNVKDVDFIEISLIGTIYADGKVLSLQMIFWTNIQNILIGL